MTDDLQAKAIAELHSYYPENVHPHGYFMDDSTDGHHFDEPLAIELKNQFSGMAVLDLGCGKGQYVRCLRGGFTSAIGVDGNNSFESIEGESLSPVIGGVDLSQPFDQIHRYSPSGKWQHCSDAVLSMEVGEHIPAEFAGTFFDNVCKNASKIIVLSWAIPGQGGRGHVNERPNTWVIFQMVNRGWEYEASKTEYLRSVATLPWFKNTLMVFVRTSS